MYKVAAENQEQTYHEKNGSKHQYCPENYPEKVEHLSPHMQRHTDDDNNNNDTGNNHIFTVFFVFILLWSATFA